MDKYFDTGMVTIGEAKDTELISSCENMDVYDVEKISKAVGHHIEMLTVINDNPIDITIMSKFGHRWDKAILYWNEARLFRNMSELRVKADKGAKYSVTEFILVANGTYLEQDNKNMLV